MPLGMCVGVGEYHVLLQFDMLQQACHTEGDTYDKSTRENLLQFAWSLRRYGITA